MTQAVLAMSQSTPYMVGCVFSDCLGNQVYERGYRQEFVCVKKMDLSWKIGNSIKQGVLNEIARE